MCIRDSDYDRGNTGLWLFDPTVSGFSAPRNIWLSGVGNWDASRSRIAAADNNGDGKTEIAVLYDYDLDNTGLWLFDPTVSGFSAPRNIWLSGVGNWDASRSRIAAADNNGDGKTEIAVLYDYDLDNTGLWLFDPTVSGFSAPRNIWLSGVGNWDASRSRIAAADNNGDGKTEIAVLYDYDLDNTGLWLFDPTVSGFSAPRNIWLSGVGNWDASRSRIAAADNNGDGKTEIAVLYDYDLDNTGLWLFDPTVSGFSAPRNIWLSGVGNWDASRSRIAAADNNGDGKTEIAVLYDYDLDNTGLWLFDPTVSGFSAPRNIWLSGVGNWDASRSRIAAADNNGDGKTEIAVLYDYDLDNTGLWLFDPTVSGFSAPRNIWLSGVGNWDASRSRIAAADNNGDGKTEIAVLYDYDLDNTGLWLFDPTVSGFSAPRNIWLSGVGNWDASRSRIAAADNNGDGKTEIAVLYDYDLDNTGLWLFDPTVSGFSAPRNIWLSGVGNWDTSRSRIVAADNNNDGKTELAVLYDYDRGNTGLWLFDPTVSGFSAPRNIWLSGVGNWDWFRSRLTVADYNDDGKSELVVLYGYDRANTCLLYTSDA